MSVLQTEISSQVHYQVPYWAGGADRAHYQMGLVIASAADGGFPFAIYEGACDDPLAMLRGGYPTLRDAVRGCVEEYHKRHPGQVITLVREASCVPSEMVYGLDDSRVGERADAVQMDLPFPPAGQPNQQ